MASELQKSSAFFRVIEKLKIFLKIYRLVRKTSHQLSISRLETTNPAELRAILEPQDWAYGKVLPEGISPEDEVALLALNDCDDAVALYLDLLKEALGDDIESIAWWRFVPRPYRKVWITLEIEDKPYELNDHSHIQVKVDGKVLSFDMTGEQFGWQSPIAEIDTYYNEFCDQSELSPWETDLEEEMDEANKDHFLAPLQAYVSRGIEESGTTWDDIIKKSGTEREAEEQKLLDSIEARVVELGACFKDYLEEKDREKKEETERVEEEEQPRVW